MISCENSVLNMDGGSIKNHYADSHEGGVCLYEYNAPAKFNLYGGTITENRAPGDGGGVYFNNVGFTIAPENGKTVTIRNNLLIDSMDDTEGTANNVFLQWADNQNRECAESFQNRNHRRRPCGNLHCGLSRQQSGYRSRCIFHRG
jgi:hypothetical protein